jgi:hypothetical protein
MSGNMEAIAILLGRLGAGIAVVVCRVGCFFGFYWDLGVLEVV